MVSISVQGKDHAGAWAGAWERFRVLTDFTRSSPAPLAPRSPQEVEEQLAMSGEGMSIVPPGKLVRWQALIGARTIAWCGDLAVTRFPCVRGAAILALVMAGCGAPTPPPPVPTPSVSPMQASRAPLQAGEKLPPLQCAGWLNGDSPRFAEGAQGLVVVDLWADWCPVVHETAPALRETYEKYAPRGVKWVSLTSGGEASAQALAARFELPWPQGYGLNTSQIADLGVSNADMGMTGYEVKPTIYLVKADGTVLWNDGHARMNHWPAAKTQAALQAEIEKHLSASTP